MDSSGIATIEFSLVGKSQSNGKVERPTQEVQGQVRTLTRRLEEMSRTRIEPTHEILHWMVECAAQAIQPFKVHSDDKRTSRERIRVIRVYLKSYRLGRMCTRNLQNHCLYEKKKHNGKNEYGLETFVRYQPGGSQMQIQQTP